MAHKINETLLATCIVKPAVIQNNDLIQWVQDNGNNAQWLLAHTLEGIVWGRREESNATWLIPEMVSSFRQPTLRQKKPQQLKKLQQLWLFGENGEIYLWWDGGMWQQREIIEGHVEFKP